MQLLWLHGTAPGPPSPPTGAALPLRRWPLPSLQTGKEKELGITDQVALNRLLDYQGLMPATPDEPRVLLLLNGTLRLHPLPVLLFASGHVAFVQRLPWK